MKANIHKITRREMEWGGLRLPVYSLNTVVVGSGAAGLSFVLRLPESLRVAGEIEN